MQAGQLKHKISILKPCPTQANSFGQKKLALAPFRTAKASISPISGAELQYAKTWGAEVTHKIQIRYQPGILPTHIIQFACRQFEIKAVLDVDGSDEMMGERRRYLTIMAVEMVVT